MEIDFKTLPYNMRQLARDERGLPVPFFVDYVNGKPDFRVMDARAYRRAVKEKRCWVCGTKLFYRLCFVAGPMCGINRTSAEPPSHVGCARWSALNCPFLSMPKMVRREDEVLNAATLRESAPGFALARNPGVIMLWITSNYEVFDDGQGKPLITMGEPTAVEWYREKRPATRQEIQESIDGGLPMLREVASVRMAGLSTSTVQLPGSPNTCPLRHRG